MTNRQNHVLSLNGDGDYVEIENNDGLNAITSAVTIEAWIHPTAFPNQWIPIIYKGDKRTSSISNRSYTLWGTNSGYIHFSLSPAGQRSIALNSPSGWIQLNRWYHVAGAVDGARGVMRLFINGVEVLHQSVARGIYRSSLPLRIGSSHEEELGEHVTFAGQINEVRVWQIARTKAEIRATMYTSLPGKELGLVGYWNFEGQGEKAIDVSGNGNHGRLMGDAKRVRGDLPTTAEPPVSISGVVRDEAKTPVGGADIHLKRGAKTLVTQHTDSEGNYQIATVEPGEYDLYATKVTKGDLRSGIRVSAGRWETVNLMLKPAVGISGRLLMLDSATPHVKTQVQAVIPPRNGESLPVVVQTVLSDENGKYQFVNLKSGAYQVRCYTTKGYTYYQQGAVLAYQRDRPIRNIDFHVAPFKAGVWRNYTVFDGLAANGVRAIESDADGRVWFGTSGGLCRFDGETFEIFTEEDGLPTRKLNVRAIYRQPHGPLWIGTDGHGVFRYDGETFQHFTKEDGLHSDDVATIAGDKAGNIRRWIR
ncbi:carboxypeptidase regulatory-like domain-containing protein [Candidatus Poribacteria bacterium]|nr:carboxypeptidase regulatory-like domain-containing protein [Candidatus Poribacteria bacterium]